jgi:hypothetical protein
MVLWVTTSSNVVGSYERFGPICYLYLYGRRCCLLLQGCRKKDFSFHRNVIKSVNFSSAVTAEGNFCRRRNEEGWRRNLKHPILLFYFPLQSTFCLWNRTLGARFCYIYIHILPISKHTSIENYGILFSRNNLILRSGEKKFTMVI